MPWVNNDLYKMIPRKEILKRKSTKELIKIANELLIKPNDYTDKADLIKEILSVENEISGI